MCFAAQNPKVKGSFGTCDQAGARKIAIDKEQVITGVSDLGLRILPYTAQHAYELFGLPLFHFDPFDRQIIAQALSEDVPVVTSDEKFSRYKGLKVIW